MATCEVFTGKVGDDVDEEFGEEEDAVHGADMFSFAMWRTRKGYKEIGFYMSVGLLAKL